MSSDSSDNSDSDIESSSNNEESLSSDEDMEHTNNLQLTGEILKDYNIICELGRGSYSIVWLAFNIVDNKFYALKVQDPKEYKAGVDEIKFVQKLPKQPAVFNNIIDSFVEIRGTSKNNIKYLCSVWNLHCGNIDNIIRKSNYTNGLPLHLVKRIMKQLITAVEILHKRFKVFHGDIKTDNILIKGLNAKDEFIINNYMKEQFFEKYSSAKDNYISKKGVIEMKEKLMIRAIVHKKITNTVLELYEKSGVSKYTIDSKYIDNIEISLADFGTHCSEENHYDSAFGTRYYMAPEIILMGRCSYPVDIWAIGCTFYELLTGELLFDPIKDSKHSRDYYHLQLIADTCGEFSHSCIKKTKYMKQYFDANYKLIGYKCPEQNRLDRKLNEKIKDTDQIKNFILGMLQPETSKRYTIEQLAKHSFMLM